MAITEATIRQVRYFPELLPDARVVSVSAGLEAAPPILDLRRFGKYLSLTNIAVEQDANAAIRIRNDQERDEVSCVGLPDLTPGLWDVLATEFLYLNLYGLTNLTNFRISFGAWIWEPTVADVLKMKKPLTPEQSSIAQKLGIRETVEKGLLPLPIDYQMQREYQLIDRKTYVYAGTITTLESVIRTMTAKIDEFIVLEYIACSAGLVTDNIRIRVDRDNDADYVELPAYSLPTTGIQCWIPAMHEVKIKLVANTTTSVVMQYTVGRYALTNLLRVRFGLLGKSDAPGDLYDKVKGGVI